MSKVFRLYNIQGNNNITDWQESTGGYSTQAISEITDPDGADAKKEITSIPSPFARIDLIKTAFREVVAMANRRKDDKEYAAFDGDTIYHKMVSDTLDVAEIFFNLDNYKGFFEIIVWDKQNDLDMNNVFGKTLERYLDSDSQPDENGREPYNFSRLNRIYMLNYIGPGCPGKINIVGATSPATLFFSPVNDKDENDKNQLNYVSQNIAFNQDKPFDDSFQPLFKRSFEFQEYLYTFREAYGAGKFHNDFPEIDDYLISYAGKVCNYNFLSQQQKNVINNLNANSINNYNLIQIGDKGQNTLEILGKPFHKKSNAINWRSDFEINSNLLGQGNGRPLVLPVENGNTYANLTYTTGPWGNVNKAPYYDATPWLNRRLPAVLVPYPYLTISDFLTDTIVRMPYEIDNNNFFDGNLDNSDGKDADGNPCKFSYLLPLTDLFFQFFTVEQLMGIMGNNRKMFELQDNAGGVTAILRIPVAGGMIEYRRTYFEMVNTVDIQNNDGKLLDKKIGLGIMPLIRFPDNVQKDYRIAMFDSGANDVVLSCNDGNNTIPAKQIIREKKQKIGSRDVCSNESYIVGANFDRIHVRVGNITEGYIVPKFQVKNGNVQYTFAVDFGTTNTHIEYCTNTNTNPVGFDITSNERQLHKLHRAYGNDFDISAGFLQNFIPETIGDNDGYSFPMRTVFSQRKSIDYDQMPMPLADGNIPFLYEKQSTPDYNETKTDLKWGIIHDRLLEMHLETLFILMRNKVALNGGDLASTKIVWFYPASMAPGKIDQFKDNWENAYKKYFGKNIENVVSISESTAPYSYYSKKMGARTEVVTIDIGGGTSDVFVVENRIPKVLMSFRFASNAIFGDGYNWDSDNNGFVKLYKSTFERILTDNKLLELQQVLKQIELQKKSPDIIAFLFSLIGDKVNKNPSLNFLQQLSRNDRMRYVFIIFYASILYFIAKSMKIKGLKKPLTLAFSGNGSLSLQIVSNSAPTIARFAQLIFDGVYDDGNKGEIQVIMEENPKKATCKGGILNPVSQDYDKIGDIKTILLGNDFDIIPEERITYADITITPEIEKGVLSSVKDFFNFLFKLHRDNNDFLCNNLNADPAIYAKVREICLNETALSQSLSEGLNFKRQEKDVTETTKVEETLFFYPLTGVLHDLALKISEM